MNEILSNYLNVSYRNTLLNHGGEREIWRGLVGAGVEKVNKVVTGPRKTNLLVRGGDVAWYEE